MHRSAIALLLAGLLPTSYLLAQQCNTDSFTIESIDGEVYLEIADSEDPVAEFHIPARFNQLHVQDSVLEHQGGELLVDGVPVATLPVSNIEAGFVTNTEIANGAVTASKIATGAISTSEIHSDAVVGSKIAYNSVDGNHIGEGEVDTQDLSDNAVTSDKIMDYSILNEDFESNSITTYKIKDGDLQGRDIAGQTITAQNILDGTITGEEIKDHTITDEKIAFYAVTGDTIMDGTIRAIDFLAGTITSSKMATGAVESSNILDGTIREQDIDYEAINSVHIQTGAVTSVEIEDGSIVTEDLGNDVVTSIKIKDRTIRASDFAADTLTSNEIAANSVYSEEILDGTIQTIDIKDGAVSQEEIMDGAIQTHHFANGAVTSDKIVDGAITYNHIADGAVTSDKIEFGAIKPHMMGFSDNKVEASTPFVLMGGEENIYFRDYTSEVSIVDNTVDQTFFALCHTYDTCYIISHPDSFDAYTSLQEFTFNIVHWDWTHNDFHVESIYFYDDFEGFSDNLNTYSKDQVYTRSEIDNMLENIDINAKNLRHEDNDDFEGFYNRIDASSHTEEVDSYSTEQRAGFVYCGRSGTCNIDTEEYYNGEILEEDIEIPGKHACVFTWRGPNLGIHGCAPHNLEYIEELQNYLGANSVTESKLASDTIQAYHFNHASSGNTAPFLNLADGAEFTPNNGNLHFVWCNGDCDIGGTTKTSGIYAVSTLGGGPNVSVF